MTIASVTCSECGCVCGEGNWLLVDGLPVCRGCLFGDVVPLCFYPIGVVRNSQHKKGEFGLDKKGVSELRLNPGMVRFMHRVEEESQLTVVWSVHQPGALVTQFERRWDDKNVGPFAARTPNRPNGIGITEVSVLGRQGNVILVKGLDAIDGTPILDIKASLESLRRTPKTIRED